MNSGNCNDIIKLKNHWHVHLYNLCQYVSTKGIFPCSASKPKMCTCRKDDNRKFLKSLFDMCFTVVIILKLTTFSLWFMNNEQYPWSTYLICQEELLHRKIRNDIPTNYNCRNALCADKWSKNLVKSHMHR